MRYVLKRIFLNKISFVFDFYFFSLSSKRRLAFRVFFCGRVVVFIDRAFVVGRREFFFFRSVYLVFLFCFVLLFVGFIGVWRWFLGV